MEQDWVHLGQNRFAALPRDGIRICLGLAGAYFAFGWGRSRFGWLQPEKSLQMVLLDTEFAAKKLKYRTPKK